MKQTALIAGTLLLGIGTGYFVSSSDAVAARTARSGETVELETLRRERFEDTRRIAELEAEIERLKALLAATTAEEVPYPGDTVEKVERLLNEAYAENNVDWLLEVIDRLLAMGEDGYPLLRKLIMDLLFKSKFLPAESDFRIDQLYKGGRIFANREKNVIGFLNYLLLQPDTHPWLKQGAMMGGAFYVGSSAPGCDELQQTMMQMFMQSQGMQIPGMMPGNMGKRMQVFAMAMSGNKEMITPLREELKNTDDKRMQSDIIGALAYLGDPGTVPLIKERLDPTQGDWRKEIQALGRVGTEEAHATATAFLRSIPDSKRFYEHTRSYVRQGGGSAAVLLMRERIQADPKDPEVANTIGTLRRFPTQESLDTLNLIATSSPDLDVQKRATDAAADVDRRLKGEIPDH